MSNEWQNRDYAVDADRTYHERYFRENNLSAPGSWLAGPDEFVLRQARSLAKNSYVVDVGCGPGRHAIPIALYLKSLGGRVLCIDYLPIALERLSEAAEAAGVVDQIETQAIDVATTSLLAGSYDMCLAWSVWEATVPCADIAAKLVELQEAAKSGGGLNVIMFNTEMRRFDASSGVELDASSKLGNFNARDLLSLLRRLYEGWSAIRIETRDDEEFVADGNRTDRWTAKQVLFSARKP
ncbi:class I SAM-dependent methyltransferase [Paraburkholderia agricolaris]|uniref:Class I SAM-dependent methyltransferase n=1 Tax=Paraburkholderia agricolaris TaxID=2152888 RepID=A0ABW9A2F3_9BURK